MFVGLVARGSSRHLFSEDLEVHPRLCFYLRPRLLFLTLTYLCGVELRSRLTDGPKPHTHTHTQAHTHLLPLPCHICLHAFKCPILSFTSPFRPFFFCVLPFVSKFSGIKLGIDLYNGFENRRSNSTADDRKKADTIKFIDRANYSFIHHLCVQGPTQRKKGGRGSEMCVTFKSFPFLFGSSRTSKGSFVCPDTKAHVAWSPTGTDWQRESERHTQRERRRK